MKLGYWPPGEETILSFMGETSQYCYNLLGEFDKYCEINLGFFLDNLVLYLKKLWILQIVESI